MFIEQGGAILINKCITHTYTYTSCISSTEYRLRPYGAFYTWCGCVKIFVLEYMKLTLYFELEITFSKYRSVSDV